jgi:thiol-disulfide isomerase/thioredoxin
MKVIYLLINALIIILAFSCSKSIEQPNANPQQILKEYMTWYSYHYNNINLSKDYIALDENAKIIDKENFLKSLSSGKYVAFKLVTSDSTLKYKLHSLNAKTDKEIVSIITQIGNTYYQYFKREGETIPEFNFTDLNGKLYNPVTTKNKIVVLKCWFIRCSMCVKEMPKLNEIVKKYKNRDDVIFLSLAYDDKEKLRNFLKKTKFDYAVSPVSEQYLDEKLKVTGFPTHIIVGKKGLISKVTSNAEEMIGALEDELLK